MPIAILGGGTDNVVQAAAENYNQTSSNTVTYNTVGETTAQQQLSNESTDFAISSTFYDSRYDTPRTISNIPLLFSPIAIVYNVNGVKTLKLSSNTLAKIFAGQITKWNDPAIKAENTKATLSSTPIRVVYPSSIVDETYEFTNYLNKTNPTIWTKVASTSFSSAFPGSMPTDGSFIAGTTTAAILDRVKAANGAIAYAEFKDTVNTNPTIAYIKNFANQYVKPSSTTAQKFISRNASINTNTGNVTFDYGNTNAKGGYPIVAVYYGLWSTSTIVSKRAVVKEFFKYMVEKYLPTNRYYAKTSGINTNKVTALIAQIGN